MDLRRLRSRNRHRRKRTIRSIWPSPTRAMRTAGHKPRGYGHNRRRTSNHGHRTRRCRSSTFSLHANANGSRHVYRQPTAGIGNEPRSKNASIVLQRARSALEIAGHARERDVLAPGLSIASIDALVEIGDDDRVAQHVVVLAVDAAFHLEDFTAILPYQRTVTLRA